MSDIAKKVLWSICLSIPSAAVGVIFREVFQAWGVFDPFSEWLGGWLKMHVTPAQIEWTIAGIIAVVAYAALVLIVWRCHRIPPIAGATLSPYIYQAQRDMQVCTTGVQHTESSPQPIASPFQSRWPLAQVVIDYVALSVAISQHEACLALQRHMLDGSIKARGPFNSTSVAEIDSEFWRFALPDQEGRANNLSSFDCLPWFEVCANDVLAIWPATRKTTK